MRRVLSICERLLGPEHPQVFRTLSNLARTNCLQGRYQDAEPLYVRALKMGEHSLGPAHPDVVATLYTMPRFCESCIGRQKRARSRPGFGSYVRSPIKTIPRDSR